MSVDQAKTVRELAAAKQKADSKAEKDKATERLNEFHRRHVNHTVELTEILEKITGLESRLTILGYLQRGGTPSAADRVLATRLGTACAELLHEGRYGVMLAVRGHSTKPVPLEEVAGKKNFVPMDHPLIQSARLVETSFGD
jgi:6-phosphofructokinase 1